MADRYLHWTNTRPGRPRDSQARPPPTRTAAPLVGGAARTRRRPSHPAAPDARDAARRQGGAGAHTKELTAALAGAGVPVRATRRRGAGRTLRRRSRRRYGHTRRTGTTRVHETLHPVMRRSPVRPRRAARARPTRRPPPGGGAAGPRGLRPLARQGDRRRPHGAAGTARARGHGRGRRFDAPLPPLPQVGLRQRPGHRDRRARVRRESGEEPGDRLGAPAPGKHGTGHRRRRGIGESVAGRCPGRRPRRRPRRPRSRRPTSRVAEALGGTALRSTRRGRRRSPHRGGAPTAAWTWSCTTRASPGTACWPT